MVSFKSIPKGSQTKLGFDTSTSTGALEYAHRDSDGTRFYCARCAIDPEFGIHCRTCARLFKADSAVCDYCMDDRMPRFVGSLRNKLTEEGIAHTAGIILAGKVAGALESEFKDLHVALNRAHPLDRQHNQFPDIRNKQVRNKPSKIRSKKFRKLKSYPTNVIYDGLLASENLHFSSVIK